MTTAPTIEGRVEKLYRAGRRPELVDVPELPFLMLDGEGPPASEGFQAAIQALFAVSYTLKFALKHAGGPAFRVSPLEGLWASPDLESWTLLIRQPPAVTRELVAQAAADVLAKKHLVAAEQARLETFDEGLSAQVLHVGPYAAEQPTIELLHAFIASQGYTSRGRHHEIYLGDPRRAAPDRLKTIIRQPVVAV